MSNDTTPLKKSDMLRDPFKQFAAWWELAVQADVPEMSAMTLATATSEGRPSARIVLLRDFGENGFVFYTNYDSRKGGELLSNPHAALMLYWQPLGKQIRIEGGMEKITPEESDRYFQARPRESQMGAWASDQSQVIADHRILEDRIQELSTQYADGNIPRPPHWGGFRLIPHTIEFWQLQDYRLHDRFQYRHHTTGNWEIARLAP